MKRCGQAYLSKVPVERNFSKAGKRSGAVHWDVRQEWTFFQLLSRMAVVQVPTVSAARENLKGVLTHGAKFPRPETSP